MKFGQVDNPDDIDFTLPAQHPHNAEILAKANHDTKIFIGCSKWTRPNWIGTIFPKGTKQADLLSEYSKQFNTVELNATHYRVFPEKTVQGWKDKAQEGFKFCPKFPQFISHIKRLQDVDRMTDNFVSSVYQLGDKLGPSFLQLHHTFGPKDIALLENYLNQLPEDFERFVEVRDEKWFEDPAQLDELVSLLEITNTGLVITDTSGRRDVAHMRLSNTSAMIRFVGNSLHKSDYTRIDDWVKILLDWCAQGMKEIYFFVHQHDDLHTADLSLYLIQQLNKLGDTQIPLPPFAEQQGSLF